LNREKHEKAERKAKTLEKMRIGLKDILKSIIYL